MRSSSQTPPSLRFTESLLTSEEEAPSPKRRLRADPARRGFGAEFDCVQRGEATTPKPRDRGSLAATRPSITRGKVSLRERRLGPAPGPAPSAQARAGARSPADIRRLSESAIRARHPSQKLRPRQGGGGVAHWWKGAGRRRRMCRAFGDRSRRCGGGGGGRRRRRRRRRKII